MDSSVVIIEAKICTTTKKKSGTNWVCQFRDRPSISMAECVEGVGTEQ